MTPAPSGHHHGSVCPLPTPFFSHTQSAAFRFRLDYSTPATLVARQSIPTLDQFRLDFSEGGFIQ